MEYRMEKEIYKQFLPDFEDYGCMDYRDTILKGMPGVGILCGFPVTGGLKNQKKRQGIFLILWHFLVRDLRFFSDGL